MQMNTSRLKLNIQRTTILFVTVVLLLSVGASAAEVGEPFYGDAIPLSSYPFRVVNNNNGTDTVVSTIETGPIWQWNITRPSYASGWHTTDGNPFEITVQEYDGQFLITGYVWPNGKIIDISELDPDAIFNVNYDCTFQLDLPPYPFSSGEVYVSLVPRFRLLRSSGGQIAMVNGESVWNRLLNTDDYGEALTLNVKGSQDVDLSYTNDVPQYPLKYIELKWQFNIRVETVTSSAGLYFSMLKDKMTFSYDREHVSTDSELAKKLNDEVGKIGDDLAAAGDAFDKVPEPDISDVMKPVDQLVDAGAMKQFSAFSGIITGSALIVSYLTILGIVMMFAYVLFGKRDA